MDREDLTPEQTSVLDGLVRDLARAAALGLIPESGATISKRGEFIINPSNIEAAEDAKMRTYRYKEFPKCLYRGGETMDVNNPQAQAGAVAEGWAETPPTPPAVGDEDALPPPEPSERPARGRRRT